MAQKRYVRTIIKVYIEVKYAGKGLTPYNFLPRAIKIGRNAWAAYRLVFGGRLYRFYAVLILVRLGAAFPGGFYGVVAFIFFQGLIYAQVVKTYFEYFPNCG